MTPRTASSFDRPYAAPGFTSYRYSTGGTFIMIGATDDADALREAARSLDAGVAVVPALLDRWDGEKYVPVIGGSKP